MEGDKDAMDDPEEWDEADSGGERMAGSAVKEDEEELEEDGVQRRRRQLRHTAAEPQPVYCREAHELQPERKKSNGVLVKGLDLNLT